MNDRIKELSRLKVFVVDDEPAARDVLANDLRALPGIGEVECYASYEDATLPMLEKQPDALFLDVEMPGRNGAEFLDSVQKRINFPIRVVFYTGFSNYMLDAIRHSAFDFLLKPYKMDELKMVVDKLCKDCNSVRNFDMCALGKMQMPSRKLAIQTVCELLLLTMDELLYMQYDKNMRSWNIYLTDGGVHRLRQGTKADMLLALHSSLVRISSNCIVNIDYLAAVENGTLRCRFCPPFDGMELVVSRRYYAKLKERFDMV